MWCIANTWCITVQWDIRRARSVFSCADESREWGRARRSSMSCSHQCISFLWIICFVASRAFLIMLKTKQNKWNIKCKDPKTNFNILFFASSSSSSVLCRHRGVAFFFFIPAWHSCATVLRYLWSAFCTWCNCGATRLLPEIGFPFSNSGDDDDDDDDYNDMTGKKTYTLKYRVLESMRAYANYNNPIRYVK